MLLKRSTAGCFNSDSKMFSSNIKAAIQHSYQVFPNHNDDEDDECNYARRSLKQVTHAGTLSALQLPTGLFSSDDHPDGSKWKWEEIREDVWVWLVCEGGGGTLTCVGERSSSCLTYGGTPGSSLPLSSSHAAQISPILMKVLGVSAENHKGPSWPPQESILGVGWVPGGSRGKGGGGEMPFLGS